MREAFRSLTTRGRAFLAAGLTAGICAVLLGQDDLLRVAALLAVLPVVAAWLTARRRDRLSLRRHVAPDRITVGQEAAVTLTVVNGGAGAVGSLLLEEQVPFTLGSRPRFLVPRIEGNHAVDLVYRVRPELRGRYPLGPLRVRVDDPFGMLELSRTFHRTEHVTVLPPVEALPAIGLGGGASGSGDHRTRAFAVGSAEDVTVRDYRRGDDLRRVHWRSSARVGELMVRREEQPWESRATVLLDNRAGAHAGTGALSSFETAVRAAASVGSHLAALGHQVDLVTSAGRLHAGPPHPAHDRGRAGDTRQLLDSLAVIATHDTARWEAAAAEELRPGGIVVAVLGSVHEPDRRALARLRQHAGTALAIVLDTPAWAGAARAHAPDGDGVATWLGTQGWRAVVAGPRDRLPEVWRELGATAGARR